MLGRASCARGPLSTSYLASTECSSIHLSSPLSLCLSKPRCALCHFPSSSVLTLLLAGLLPIPISPPQTCSLLQRHLIGPHIFVTSTNEDDFLAEANLTVMTPFAMPAYFHGRTQTAGMILAQNERNNE